MKYISIFLITTIIISSCEEEIPADKLNSYTEKIVVNEIFNNDKPFSIQISNSKIAYNEENPTLLGPDEIIDVSLKEGDKIIHLSFDAFSKTYFSTVLPVPGKQYNLMISSKNYISVYSKGYMPQNVSNMASTWIENGGIDMNGNKSDMLKVTFSDDASTNDYYKINFMYYSELVDKFNSFDFKTSDILTAASTMKTRDGGFLFSDELFNGTTKTLTAIPPSGLVKSNTTYKYLITIEKLSKDFWKYYTTLEQYRGGANGTFATDLFKGAVVVYSNINNGLGIFAGSSVKSDTLK
ncbi:MAG: DUF4249 domain-containing protein [Bacteroidia bacterium]|nr:DUF4249 domain-containing protein [Bacteroidia bacterium]